MLSLSGDRFFIGALFAGALAVAAAAAFNPNLASSRHFLAPPPHLEKISFGFQESLADALWIRALQDVDRCERGAVPQSCQGNSWLYQMLETVTNLSPYFRMPYATGALALSVVVDDTQGATLLFRKGIKAFPTEWPLLYRAAYHFLYEEKDGKMAADLLVAAAQNGGPVWLNSLANRLYMDSGHRVLAEALLRDLTRSGADPQLLQRMREKIRQFEKSGPQNEAN